MVERGATTKILIAGDPTIFRAALRRLQGSAPGTTVVGEAGNGNEARKLLRKLKPDVVLLNIPKQSRLKTLRQLTSERTKACIILVVKAIEGREILEALRLGVRGILYKDAAGRLLYRYIRMVMAGEYWLDRGSLCELLRTMRLSGLPVPKPRQAKDLGLTRRQSKIVSAVLEGLTNEEIAARFNISEQTLKHHLCSTFEQVGVSNRLELALYAMDQYAVSGA
jgi:DNA-binding NarL/FixJ family response regulator